MRLVSIKIIAEFLMTKQSTVYTWVHSGSIPFHRINGIIRFDMDEIENWVKTSRPAFQPVANVSFKRSGIRDVDKLIKKSVDDVKGKEYNSSNGKPGQMQGLRKED
jgi:excisionase family DNA binding protein